jgi:hypothetical protein
MRLPLTGGLAFVIVTAAPLVAEATAAASVCSAWPFITCVSLLWSSRSRQSNTGQPKAGIKFLDIAGGAWVQHYLMSQRPASTLAFKLAKISII